MQDIFLTCTARQIKALTDEITDLLSEQQLPATILVYGVTQKQHDGFIVLEWEGTVPAAFRERIASDEDISDFVIYDVPVCDPIGERGQ